MAFDILASMQAVQTHLQGSDLFREVLIKQYSSPPPVGPAAAIRPQRMYVASTTLTNPIEVHVVLVSLYYASYTQNDQDRATKAATLASAVADLIYADFTLGGRVRNVDFGGQYGSGFEVDFIPLEEIADIPTHVAEITLPLIVDGGTAFVA